MSTKKVNPAEALRVYVARAAAAVGVKPDNVVILGPRHIRIRGTGIEVIYDTVEVGGDVQEGWAIREVTELGSLSNPKDVEVNQYLYVAPPRALTEAAKMAGLAVAERKIEAYISGKKATAKKAKKG